MRLFFISNLLFLLLTFTGATIAHAQEQTNSQPETFKLFAGVSHKEVLPEAPTAVKPHLARQQQTALPHCEPLETSQSTLSAQKEQSAPAGGAPNADILAARTVSTQNYIPASGVARITAQRTADASPAAPHYTIDWFMIPSWMAGVWLKDGDMTTSVTDLRTGMSSIQNQWTPNRLQAIWGHQQDAQGNFWHVNLLPSERDGESAGKLVRFLTVAQNCESSSPGQLLTRTHYVVSETNPWNHQPIDTFQQESLNHYTLAAENQLINTSSNRVFSYQGVPVREGRLVSQFAKIGQFAPVASLNGIDLAASLNDYLQAHSLGHLRK